MKKDELETYEFSGRRFVHLLNAARMIQNRFNEPELFMKKLLGILGEQNREVTRNHHYLVGMHYVTLLVCQLAVEELYPFWAEQNDLRWRMNDLRLLVFVFESDDLDNQEGKEIWDRYREIYIEQPSERLRWLFNHFFRIVQLVRQSLDNLPAP